MGILHMFARRRGRETAANRLYLDAVAQARQPVFYLDYGVPDTTEGRFALVSLHVHLICRRLSREPAETGRDLSQALFDTMFADIDRNLREMGVGDLSVGKKIKKLAGGHYAAAQKVEWALEDGEDALADTLRSIYGEADETMAHHRSRLAQYVRAAIASLAGQDTGALLAGNVSFPSPSEIG